jgi:GntR family transcriptional regulator, rspAB operon transcriptional repressor
MTVPERVTRLEKKLRVRIKDPISIREKVYDVIRNDILNGRIPPGERLVENRLAEEIHTSRTPVREALHMLEREGLLESIPRVGYRVKQIHWDEVEEICEIRAVNETLAARWAMARITDQELHALEENLALSEQKVNAGNPQAFVELDAEFHEILARASGSGRLLELCQLLRRHMLRYRVESLLLPETALKAVDGHSRILDCMRRKDRKGIEAAIRDHLEYAKKDIRSQVPWEKERTDTRDRRARRRAPAGTRG